MLNERTWSLVFGLSVATSSIDRHPSISDSTEGGERVFMNYDPNNDIDYDAILHWIRLSDFYTFPFVTQFTSFEHLFRLLATTDFAAASRNMQNYNIIDKDDIYDKWQKILERVQDHRMDKHRAFSNSSSKCSHSRLPDDINDALHASYRVKQSDSCQGTLFA